MSDYYDRDGERISSRRWGWLYEDPHYRRVASTKLYHGAEELHVSTIWLGLDHNYGGGPPLIFETMVFGQVAAFDEYAQRYSTEAEAREGHEAVRRQVLEDLASIDERTS